MKIINQETTLARLDAIRPHPENPHEGDLGALHESIETNGFYGSVVAQRSTGYVLAGNHRLMAAQQAGADAIPVTYVDVDDETARRILLADNRIAKLGIENSAALADLLQTIQAESGTLEGTGYDAEALDELLADLAAMQPQEELAGDPDAVPDVPAEPVTKRDDLIRLGNHLLLCGDSTVLTDVERVMDGAQADMVWTDPPYGVAYQANESLESLKARNRRTDGLVVENDSMSEPELERFLQSALSNAWSVCKPGGVWYVAAPPGPLNVIFGTILSDLAVFRAAIMWVKQQFVFGRTDYHYRHEPIFYGWKEGAAHYFVDDRTQDSVWEIDRPSTSKDHPTMKPVELVARAIRNSSKAGQIVLDVFGGSGTTLIACEQEGRHARLIELDPKYVDVIVRRWETLTGKTAVRQATDARVPAGA